MARNGLTYSQAYNTTLEEFEVYRRAFEIQMIDSMHLVAKNAWLTQSAKATKGKGKNIKSAYKDFKDFYDWDRELENLFTGKMLSRKVDRLSELNRLMNEYLEKGDEVNVV